MEPGQEPLPFVCGYCQLQFDQLFQYCTHLRQHGEACSSSLHFCDNLSGLGSSMYSCKKCQLDFPTICTLHCHLLGCCGSYIYDHKASEACPVEDLYKFTSDRNNEVSEKETQTVLHEYNDNNETCVFKANVSFQENCTQTDEFNYEQTSYNLSAKKTAVTEHSVLAQVEDKIKDKKKHNEQLSTRVEKIPINEESMRTRVPAQGEGQIRPRTEAGKRQKTKEEKILINERSKVKIRKRYIPRYERPHTRGMSSRYRRSESSETLAPVKKRKKSVINNKFTVLSENFNSEFVKSTRPGCSSTKTSAQLDNTDTIEKKCNLESSTLSKGKRTERLTKSNLPVKAAIKEKKDISCEVCGKLFMDNSKLRHHMISHSDARSYVCSVCSASYKYPNHLKVHMKSHDAVKPCYCELCGEGFLEIQRLKAHKIHKHSTDRNYQCPECGVSLKFPYTLKRHMLKHSSEKAHQCEVCGQRFSRKYYLVQHMWTHNNTRRFPCTVHNCNRQFRTNYQLQCHLKLHSGERPWKCLECPAEFIQRKELRQHLKKIHGQILDDMAHQYQAMKLEPDCLTEDLVDILPSPDTSFTHLLPSSNISYSHMLPSSTSNSGVISDTPNGVNVLHVEEHSPELQTAFQTAEDSKISAVKNDPSVV